MTYYTETVEFDQFGWSPLVRSSLPVSETYGLDYESAREVTPRWYGVSFGNGNDGVSYMYPDFYVRTDDPYKLAAAALIDSMRTYDGKQYAATEVWTDGEADYCVSATLYEGPDGETEFGAEWLICDVFPVEEMPPVMLLSDRVNVQLADSDPFGKPAYCTLEDAISELAFKLA